MACSGHLCLEPSRSAFRYGLERRNVSPVRLWPVPPPRYPDSPQPRELNPVTPASSQHSILGANGAKGYHFVKIDLSGRCHNPIPLFDAGTGTWVSRNAAQKPPGAEFELACRIGSALAISMANEAMKEGPAPWTGQRAGKIASCVVLRRRGAGREP